MTRLRALLGRLRWIHLAPVLAFVALAGWAFASPVGSSPDDDYHLVSIWCADGGSAQCEAGSKPGTRDVSTALVGVACYALDPEKSAGCQDAVLDTWNRESVETPRGNFSGEYPPVYYSVMRVFAGADLQVSALLMRLVNAALFVALATVLAVVLPRRWRPTLLWGWLVTLVPLGMFLVASNNPSGWALTGVGTAFIALAGSFESSGRRRWGLVALTIIGVLMAAGARGDAAVYAAGAIVAAVIVAGPWRGVPVRSLWRWAWVPALAILISAVFFLTSGQVGVAGSGFEGSGSSVGPSPDSPKGFALVAYNLLMLPLLWTGVWGASALGWMDTGLPEIVSAAAIAAFVVLGFIGIGRMNWRKAVAAAGVLLVLIVVPVWVLTRGGNVVGENLQPRYLLPLIVLFVFVLLVTPLGTRLELTRAQTTVVFVALALANLVALQVNIRRYVTGSDQQGFNLDAGAEWWWTGFPVGPTVVWLIGAVAYAGMLAVLWPQLRRSAAVEEAPTTAR